MDKMTQLARDMQLAFMLGDINPAIDTVSESVAKYKKHGFRHLLVTTSNGGLLCLCSDPELSRRLMALIRKTVAEMDGEETLTPYDMGDTFISMQKNTGV